MVSRTDRGELPMSGESTRKQVQATPLVRVVDDVGTMAESTMVCSMGAALPQEGTA
jgi:hypothetical protein